MWQANIWVTEVGNFRERMRKPKEPGKTYVDSVQQQKEREKGGGEGRREGGEEKGEIMLF